jgi:hypothetical protein
MRETILREYSLQGRVKVLDYPYAAPSKCVVCGSGPEAGRKFIDFGQQLEFYGAIYYCSDCMREVAMCVGFYPVAEFEKLEDMYHNLSAKYDRDLAELEGYRDVFASLRRSGISVPSIPSSSFDLSKDAVPQPEEYDQPAQLAGGSDSGSDESSSVKGPDNVHAVAARTTKRSSGL